MVSHAPVKEQILVLLPPAKPVVIYDGECNFCSFWIRQCDASTKNRVEYVASQNREMILRFPEIPRQRFVESVQLVETSGLVFEGAEAVFRTITYSWAGRFPLWAYRKVPGVKPLSEAGYYFVARHRTFFSRLTKWIFRPGY